MKRCSTSLIVKEMQIKTTMRYHFTPVRMVNIKKTRGTKCCWGYGEKRTLVNCWWECKLVQPLWETVWRFVKKLKIELPYDSATLLLEVYSKEMQTLCWRNICIPIFTAALSIIAKTWKQPKCPLTNEWIKKLLSNFTMEYYSAIKKKEILSFATTCMDLESIMLNEVSQTEKDKYCMNSLICGL